MKSSTKDQIKGKLSEVKGKVKQAVGEATDNRRLVEEGQDDKAAGTIQKKVGQIKKVFEK